MTARAAVTALLALLLVLPGTAAAAAWLAPVHFGGTTGAAPSPAVDASGNALVGWQVGTPSVIQEARHASERPASPRSRTSRPPPHSRPSPRSWSSTVSAAASPRGCRHGPMPNDKQIDILALLPNGTKAV